MVKCSHAPTCHSERAQRAEESSQVAGFILCRSFPQRGGFLHSADATVGMTYRGVVPLIRTGYMRNVAGGRLPPLRQCTTFLAFYRTQIGNRNVKRCGSIHPHGLYSSRCLAMNHRRYIAWYRSSAQVVFETWRAASSRPYWRLTIHSHRLYLRRCRNGTQAVPYGFAGRFFF